MKSCVLCRVAKFALMALVLGLVTFAGSARTATVSAGAVQRGEFMIVNKTSYTFMKLFLSSSNRRAWGPDQLGRKVIQPEASYTLTGIPCGLYDVKVVDEEGDACVVTEIAMCKNHTHWELTNDLLASCEGY